MKIGNVATLVAEGVTFNGDIELKGQMIVAGNVNGAIKADEETSLANIRVNTPEIIRMYTEAHMSTIEFGTRMPAELVRKGNRTASKRR